jgi:hypothetical protein
MDLLLSPTKYVEPIEYAPFVAARWDLGHFMTYLKRCGMAGVTNLELQSISTRLRTDDSREELFSPPIELPKDCFYQTWFFFGIAAEFLGLNLRVDGTRQVDMLTAKETLDTLYENCVIEIDGIKYLSGQFMLHYMPIVEERLLGIADNVTLEAHLDYLMECIGSVVRTNAKLERLRPDLVSGTTRYSTEALASAFTGVVVQVKHRQTKRTKLRSGNGCDGYLASQSVIQRMGRLGWCKSDIEGARSQFSALHTRNFLSYMLKESTPRDHSKCTNRACGYTQINLATYKTVHIFETCQCADIISTEEASTRVLQQTTSFPVLRLVKSASTGEITLEVEEYKSGLNYVALSHVSLIFYGGYNYHLVRIRPPLGPRC